MPPWRHHPLPLHFTPRVHLKDVSESNECERGSDEAARENCADSQQSDRVMLSPTRPQSLSAFWIIYILLYDQGRTSYNWLIYRQISSRGRQLSFCEHQNLPNAQTASSQTHTANGTLLDMNEEKSAHSEPCDGGGEKRGGHFFSLSALEAIRVDRAERMDLNGLGPREGKKATKRGLY